MTPERQVQNAICQYLSLKKNIIFWVNKTQGTFDPIRKTFRSNKDPYFRKGISDICGVFTKTGRAFFIEVKSKKGRLSPEQRDFIEDMSNSNAIAFVARSIEDVERCLIDDCEKTS